MDLNELKNEHVDSKLELDNESISYLNETRKWANFLAILGFVFLGLMVLMSFSFGAAFSAFGGQGMEPPFPGFLIVVLYLIMGGIYFFPIFFLYKFSSFTKLGLEKKNQGQINLAFKNLKSHYKYIGILTIVILSLYLLVLLGMMAGGLFQFL